jgi:hypothetical protein
MAVNRGQGNPLNRINGHQFHGFDLVGGLHQADLRCDRGAGPAGEQECCQHRPQLPEKRFTDQQADLIRSTELLQCIDGLQ